MKILISGGHLTPALAFIDYFLDKEVKKSQDNSIAFVGRKYSKTNDQQLAKEAEAMSSRSIEFYHLQTGKASLYKPLGLLKEITLTIVGLIKAFWIIYKVRPDVFLSFGGYVAVPVALAAWLWGVPVVTHEQTRAAGFANKLISKFANKIAISHPQSKKYFNNDKVVLTGNLIRDEILKKSQTKPTWIKYRVSKPILYITGGSQGSEIINLTVSQILDQITKRWTVIHQCGPSTASRNYLSELTKAAKSLNKTQAKRYYVKEWINEDELSWIYSKAEGVISRAGANTTQELAMRKLPSILIPLPFSHHQEQYENAKALSDSGAAILLPQKKLNPKSLVKSLEKLEHKKRSMVRNLSDLKFKSNSESILLAELKKLI